MTVGIGHCWGDEAVLVADGITTHDDGHQDKHVMKLTKISEKNTIIAMHLGSSIADLGDGSPGYYLLNTPLIRETGDSNVIHSEFNRITKEYWEKLMESPRFKENLPTRRLGYFYVGYMQDNQIILGITLKKPDDDVYQIKLSDLVSSSYPQQYSILHEESNIEYAFYEEKFLEYGKKHGYNTESALWAAKSMIEEIEKKDSGVGGDINAVIVTPSSEEKIVFKKLR